MSVFKIRLKDGTEYQLADGEIGSHFAIVCPDKETFINIWSKMTDENLSEVTVTVDGNTLTIMTNIMLDGAQAIYSQVGTIMGLFYFHGADYSSVEPVVVDEDYIEAAKILLGEGV